jgi:hypothetical protein
MLLSSTMRKIAILSLLLHVAIGYAADDNRSLEKELMTQLFKAHTTVESFVCGKMQEKLEKLRSELAALKEAEELNVTPTALQESKKLNPEKIVLQAAHKSTSEFIDHMLRESFIDKEGDRRMIVHLMYTAIQEHRQLTPEAFEEEYRIWPDQLEKPDAQSLERLRDLLSQTVLWEDKEILLQGCEEEFKNARYRR